MTPSHARLLMFAVLTVASGGSARAQPALQPFTVEVTLSPRAAARMASLHEGITLAAAFYGVATPAARRQANSMGQIELGDERVSIPGPGRATITGRTVDTGKLGLVKNRDVMVNLNVFSARRSGPDNILFCDLFEDSVSVANRRPVHIGCKLIGE